MKVGLIHYTEDYHKLVEMTARECYQSYHKLDEDSHNFIKGIMAKGHISIASTGNLVFGVAGFSGLEEYTSIIMDLMTMKEINNYIRWTQPDPKRNPDTQVGLIVSMNMLTFLEIKREIDKYSQNTKLLENFTNLLNRVPELKWFYNKTSKVPAKENQFTAKGEPELYNPIILSEDYTELKEKGLTDYELEVHATVTVNMKVSRDIGLQMWRHADMTGGTELSQRYVDRSDAEYRKLVGVDVKEYPDFTKYLEKYPDKTEEDAKKFYDMTVNGLYSNIEEQIMYYTDVRDDLILLGIHQGRAKEIARAALPNAMTTKIIQSRPLRQWKHFFKLRDTAHAQKEIRKDILALKDAFEKAGVVI